MEPLAVRATGMITGVGLNAPASCAAVRCAIDRFQETRFVSKAGEWLIGSAVPLNPPSRGREKLLRMVTSAIAECLPALGEVPSQQVPFLLCVAEKGRPGRSQGLDARFLSDVCQELQTTFHAASAVIDNGRVGGVEAMLLARQFIEDGRPLCLVAGVDSFLVADTLSAYEAKGRLLTSQNSNGFIPGEAAGAVLLGPVRKDGPPQLVCRGLGFGREKATVDSEEPLRADGMAEAVRAAMNDGGCTFDDVDYRITDCNGEQYGFKDAALVLARTMRKVKEEFDIWHPADCIGEVGAAIVPVVLSVADHAGRKGYAPGPGVLCHFANDEGARAALILRHRENGSQ